MSATLSELRRYAVARSLFPRTTLQEAVGRLGFVQADPIRAPARAQDLTLRHRVVGYRAGDLERRYPALELEEDVLVNYGFVTRAVHALMHPRAGLGGWSASQRKRVQAILGFVRAHGTAHPRQVDDHFAHGRVTNYWGGSSNATTHLLDAMHYRGLLRVVRRDAGIRVLVASGGGCRNRVMMAGIQRYLPDVRIMRSDELGAPADEKEAIAFALIGWCTMHGLPGNEPAATGASGRRVLGTITPGKDPLILPAPLGTPIRTLTLQLELDRASA